MSATVEAAKFSRYFQDVAGQCPCLSIPGRTFPVEHIYLEHVLKRTNFVPRGGRTNRNSAQELHDFFGNKVGSGIVEKLAFMDESELNCDLIASTLEYILRTSNDGGILVFLPGAVEIEKAIARFRSSSMCSDALEVLPLHSKLPAKEQRRVFHPSSKRKIVFTTNIAETSVTVPTVKFVVDTGSVKEMRYDHGTQMPQLVTTWCSRSSAMQRAGRAGRIAEGFCYKLFSSFTMKSVMAENAIPELQRVPLEDIVLRIKLLQFNAGQGHQHPSLVLGKAMDPPSKESIDGALTRLRSIGAVADSCITPLGFHLANLPVHPRIAKMLVFGILLKCLDPVLIVAACLSSGKSLFLSPWDLPEITRRRKREPWVQVSLLIYYAPGEPTKSGKSCLHRLLAQNSAPQILFRTLQCAKCQEFASNSKPRLRAAACLRIAKNQP